MAPGSRGFDLSCWNCLRRRSRKRRSTSAAAAVAAPTAAAVLSRFGLINRQSPALDLFAVERLDPYQASVWCALGETRLRLEKKKGHSSLWIEKGALDFVGRLATGSFHQC
jgi:hypothetical protein